MGTKLISAAIAACLLANPAMAFTWGDVWDALNSNEVQTQPEGGSGYSANAGQYYNEANRIRDMMASDNGVDTPENRELVRELEKTGKDLDDIFGTDSKVPPKAENAADNADSKFGNAHLNMQASALYDTPNTLKRAENGVKKAKKAKNNLKKKVKK